MKGKLDTTFDEGHGVVVRTTNEGVLLQPFGDTCGRVPKSRTGVEPVEYPEELLSMGQDLKKSVNILKKAKFLTMSKCQCQY